MTTSASASAAEQEAGTDMAPLVRSKRVVWALNGAILLLAALVVWAEFGPRSASTGGRGLVVLLLVAAFAVTGVVGIPAPRGSSKRVPTVVLLAAQLGLVAGMIALGTTLSALDLLFPLVAQAAFHLRSSRAQLLVSMGIVGEILLAIALHPVTIEEAVAFVVGCGFIATMARAKASSYMWV